MKTNKIKLQIEENRETISKLLSGRDTVKRLNNLNWITHELTVETQILWIIIVKMPRHFQSKKEYKTIMNFTHL